MKSVSAIERVAQFADERSRAIRVQFTNGEVRVFSSSVETGESEVGVLSEYQGRIWKSGSMRLAFRATPFYVKQVFHVKQTPAHREPALNRLPKRLFPGALPILFRL